MKVNESQQEREQLINVANGEYNKSRSTGRAGEAEQKIKPPRVRASKRGPMKAEGECARVFQFRMIEYEKAPARIY